MRTLVESKLYTWELSQLGPIQEVDEVLNHVTWAISLLAEEFDLLRVRVRFGNSVGARASK